MTWEELIKRLCCLTSKDFDSADMLKERYVACNWTYFLWQGRGRSQHFVKVNMVMCVRERAEGVVELTSPALSGLILCSVSVIYLELYPDE